MPTRELSVKHDVAFRLCTRQMPNGAVTPAYNENVVKPYETSPSSLYMQPGQHTEPATDVALHAAGRAEQAMLLHTKARASYAKRETIVPLSQRPALTLMHAHAPDVPRHVAFTSVVKSTK